MNRDVKIQRKSRLEGLIGIILCSFRDYNLLIDSLNSLGMLKIIETLYTQVAIAKLEFFEAITKLFSLEVAITYLLALFTFHA